MGKTFKAPQWPKMHSGIAGIAQIPLRDYTIYVPHKQLVEAMTSSDVYFGIQEKKGLRP